LVSSSEVSKALHKKGLAYFSKFNCTDQRLLKVMRSHVC